MMLQAIIKQFTLSRISITHSLLQMPKFSSLAILWTMSIWCRMTSISRSASVMTRSAWTISRSDMRWAALRRHCTVRTTINVTNLTPLKIQSLSYTNLHPPHHFHYLTEAISISLNVVLSQFSVNKTAMFSFSSCVLI